jgi:hypothetical protein
VSGTVIDPQDVVRNAAAAVWSGERVWTHVRAEFVNDLDGLMATVARGVPLQYAIPRADATGALEMTTITTLDGALEHYRHVRDEHDIVDWQAIVELRNDWCVFFDGMVTQRLAGSGDIARGRSVVFFVLSDQDGITGELAWPREPAGAGPEPSPIAGGRPGAAPLPARRLDNLALHRRYLDALHANDLDALLDLITDDVQVGTRSYAAGDERFVELHGKEALTRHYEAFFAEHRVNDVALVNLVADDWYVYSELLWETCPSGATTPVRFRTAETLVLRDGRVRARVGYGTDPR